MSTYRTKEAQTWRETLVFVRLMATVGLYETGKFKKPEWFIPGITLKSITKKEIIEILNSS